MKCPTCQTWSEVKDTRGPRRRRQCANGHRFYTVETAVAMSLRGQAIAAGHARKKQRSTNDQVT
jgi:transcriptional regulator NrdR family protein